MADVGPALKTYTRAECLHRLQAGGVGRIAIASDGAPVLRPVNFALHEGRILIRTGEGSILAASGSGAAASFEIDGIDPVEHTGWSVVASGTLAGYDGDPEAAPPLRAWASGEKHDLVVIEIEEVSGLAIPAGRGNR